MSDFSPILVLQIKICIKPDRHGKGSNKIWEPLSFWRNFFNNGAIWLQSLICNRLNPRYEMQAVWLSIQRNHPLDFIRPFLAMTMPEQAHHCSSGLTKPFAYERLFLWRLMHRGCHHSSDVPSLASSDTSHMQCRHDSQSHKGTYPEWLWMTPTTYGRDFAYCLKSHGGVRGIYMSLWWLHCAPFYYRCRFFSLLYHLGA